MNEKEIGYMESELHSITARRVYDMLSDEQKVTAITDMATIILAMNERLKKLEDVVSYVSPNIRLDI